MEDDREVELSWTESKYKEGVHHQDKIITYIKLMIFFRDFFATIMDRMTVILFLKLLYFTDINLNRISGECSRYLH